MSMTPLGNKIKSASEIKSSIKRIAYQVYENNVDESKTSNLYSQGEDI